jgi:predicted ATP-grasp superfamily ATP-dependent carboligase
MRPVVLLVSTASVWLGTARMVRGLTRAGFDVVLFAPEGSLAAHSRYVTRKQLLPRDASPGIWLLALSQVVAAHDPTLVVPCDEMALRLLFTLVLSPPPALPEATRLKLDALIRHSLGDPAHYLATVDKLLLPSAAAGAGIAMPASALVEKISDAQDFAATQGYPIVLKRRYGFAGEGVRVVAAASELAEAITRLSSPDQLDLGQPSGRQVLAQAFINGPYHSQALVAWQGTPLASFGWERFVATQAIKGQTAVIRLIDSPATRAAAETVGRAFGINGFFNVQFVLDAGGTPLMLEVNRRLVTHTHFGERAGVDLPGALLAQMTGAPALATAVAPRGPDTIAVFPREWLRDPQSAYLRHGPVDVPWDEPELIEAMLALRRVS